MHPALGLERLSQRRDQGGTTVKKRGQMKAEAPAGPKTGTTRRSFLKQVGRAGLVAAGVPLVGPRVSVAAPVTLSMWSCLPDIERSYQQAGHGYANTHPG